MNTTKSHTNARVVYDPINMTADEWIAYQKGKATGIQKALPYLQNIAAAEAASDNKALFLAIGDFSDIVPDPDSIGDDAEKLGEFHVLVKLEEEATDRPRLLRVSQFRKAKGTEEGEGEDQCSDGQCSGNCSGCGNKSELEKTDSFKFHFELDPQLGGQVVAVFELKSGDTLESKKLTPLLPKDFIHQRDGVFSHKYNMYQAGGSETCRSDDFKRMYLALEVLGFEHDSAKDTF